MLFETMFNGSLSVTGDTTLNGVLNHADNIMYSGFFFWEYMGFHFLPR